MSWPYHLYKILNILVKNSNSVWETVCINLLGYQDIVMGTINCPFNISLLRAMKDSDLKVQLFYQEIVPLQNEMDNKAAKFTALINNGIRNQQKKKGSLYCYIPQFGSLLRASHIGQGILMVSNPFLLDTGMNAHNKRNQYCSLTIHFLRGQKQLTAIYN